MTYQELIKNTEFEDKKLLELLLVDYFKVDISKLLTNSLCTIDLVEYQKKLEELKAKKPYQYIKGDTNFYGRTFIVNEHVLIPRFETEGLVEHTLDFIQKHFDHPRILDLCTGSGIIAITLSKELNIPVDASDISTEALEIAKQNGDLLKADITWIQSDLFDRITDRYDVIISNPPYISLEEELPESVKDYEPSIALYALSRGVEYYEKILKNVKNYVNSHYLIAFEIGMHQKDAIIDLIHRYLKEAHYVVKQDLNSRNRYLFVYHV